MDCLQLTYGFVVFVQILCKGEATVCSKGDPYIVNAEVICFWLVTSEHDFQTSLSICESDNGSLAIIPNQDTLDFVNSLKQASGFTDEFFIGYKLNSKNELVRLDNTVQTWAAWYSDEPTGTGICVSSFNVAGTFWDEKCSSLYKAICQWPKFNAVTVQTTSEVSSASTNEIVTTSDVSSASTNEIITSSEVPSSSTNYIVTSSTNEIVTTQHVTPLATASSCQCPKTASPSNLTVSEIYEIALNISRQLSVNKETLSSTIRAKTCAKDDRPSAASIGYIGAIILAFIFGGIVILDIPVLLRTVKTSVNIISNFFVKKNPKN